MKSLKIFLCLTVLTVTFACDRAREVSARLDKIDTLMREDPDSALVLLDSMRVGEDEWSEPLRMRYELLRADAQNKAYVDFTTDSVMKVVADYYDEHGTPNDQMRAHYLLGCTYRDLKDAPMELQCFQDAVEKADTASKDCDLYTLYAVYGQIADIYYTQYLPEEELKALSMCEKIAYMDNDTLSAIKAHELRMRAFDNLNEPDSILSITDCVYKAYMDKGSTQLAARSLFMSISVLIDKQNYQEAKKRMILFENESNLFDGNRRLQYPKSIYYYDKGRYYLKENKVDSARYCFELLLQDDYIEAAYDGFLLLYSKTHQEDSVFKYNRLHREAADSNFFAKNSKTIEQLTTTYNYAHQMRIADEAKKKEMETDARNQKLVFWLILTILLIALLILLYIYKHREHERQRQEEKDIALDRYKRLNAKLAVAEEEKLTIQKSYESYQVESAESMDEYERKMAELQETISSLRQDLRALKDSNMDIDFESWLASFLDAEIVNDFKDLIRYVKPGKSSSPQKGEWKSLQKHFNKHASSFYKVMKNNYSMNESELHVMMLVIIGFTNKDISLLCEKSAQSISNVKYRIMNNLSIDGNARDLRSALLSILKEFMC